MPAGRTVEPSSASPAIVAVIASRDDLNRARRMRARPELFELRLDALAAELHDVGPAITTLRAPVIVTARHPSEGGLNNVPVGRRRELLLRFLPVAAYIDVELRSVAQLRTTLEAAVAADVKRIVSIHELQRMPRVRRLHQLADAADAIGADVFKIVARTDTPAELDRLLAFFDAVKSRMAISAMGVGKLGRESRKILARYGSALNYVHLGARRMEGQLSFGQMRRVLKR